MTNTNTVANTVTNEQIRALRVESGEAGDIVQVVMCDRALGADLDWEDYAGGGHSASEMDAIRQTCLGSVRDARDACAEVISDAAAMAEDVDHDMVSAVSSGGDRVLGSESAASVAAEWSACGLTPAQAREYIAAGCWDAGRVLELVEAGVTAEEIGSLEAEAGATSTVAYSHSNCDLSTAEVLAAVRAAR